MLDILIKQPGTKKSSPGSTPEVVVRRDKPVKSIIKSLSWRLVGTIDTIIISYFVTGKVTMALSIGSAEVITKTVLYYFHERAWIHIHRIKLNLFSKKDAKQLEIEEIEEPAGPSFRMFRFGKS